MNPYEVGYAGMDSKGPFSTISGTLMSIPFCVAAALLHGTPTMALMQRTDDPAIAALMPRIAVIADEAVPSLCARIAVTLEEGEALVQDQRMTPADYAYDRAGVSALVRRIGAEESVPAAAYDRLEAFVHALPRAAIEDALAAFALLPKGAARAAA
jgi:2-methylcitrate dehydratase PrpD